MSKSFKETKNFVYVFLIIFIILPEALLVMFGVDFPECGMFFNLTDTQVIIIRFVTLVLEYLKSHFLNLQTNKRLSKTKNKYIWEINLLLIVFLSTKLHSWLLLKFLNSILDIMILLGFFDLIFKLLKKYKYVIFKIAPLVMMTICFFLLSETI